MLIDSLGQSMDPFHSRLTALLDRAELCADALNAIVSGFRGKRMIVVGEAIMDTYVLCDQPDVAGEGPMLTLRPLETRCYDGGAAIIARHAASMGAKPVLVTVLPDDEIGAAFERRLAGEGVEVAPLRVDSPIPEKQRFVVGTQKVVKIDLVRPYVLDARQRDELAALVDGQGDADVGIVADFGLGLFTNQTSRRVCECVRRRCSFTAGDISGNRADLGAMRGLDLLTPSEGELRRSMRSFDEALPAVMWHLLEETGAGEAIVTMGPEGLVSFCPFENQKEFGDDPFGTRLKAEHVPAMVGSAVDQLGCGDALLATAALARVSGASPMASAFLGSIAAAVQAGRMGNIPVSATDLRRGIDRLAASNLAFAQADVIDSTARTRCVS